MPNKTGKRATKKAGEVAQHEKGKGKSVEQLSFDDPQWEAFMKTNLGQSVADYHKQKLEIETAEENLATLDDKVRTEMKKVGKMHLKVQLDGVFYEFQIKIREAKETLVFKRANA